MHVSFTCTNATSCPAPIDVTTEGANQIITGTATGAGGSATASVTLNIDKTPPRVAIDRPSSGAGLFIPTAAVAGGVGDDLSGVAGASCDNAAAVISGGSFSCDVTLTPGANILSATATDVAGNTASSLPVNVTYTRIAEVRITSPANLSYLNISPTTVTGTVDDPTAIVSINGIPALVSNGRSCCATPPFKSAGRSSTEQSRARPP